MEPPERSAKYYVKLTVYIMYTIWL
jgi:hypothetical protein